MEDEDECAVYETAFIEGWDSYQPDVDCPYEEPDYEAQGVDWENGEDDRLTGFQHGWIWAENYATGDQRYVHNIKTYNTFCERRGVNIMKKFVDKGGEFDEVGFRQYCITLAQQQGNRNNGAINGVQGPEPIGEILMRAQLIEHYLRHGEVNLPQVAGAEAA